jgi:hypothetical protein
MRPFRVTAYSTLPTNLTIMLKLLTYFAGLHCLHLQGRSLFCLHVVRLAYFSTLTMEAVLLSKTGIHGITSNKIIRFKTQELTPCLNGNLITLDVFVLF